MSPEAGFQTLSQALADMEAACANDEPERAACLFEAFNLVLRQATAAGRLDADELRTLQSSAVQLMDRLSRQRDALSGAMARAHRAGRATRAYLGES